MKLYSTSMLVSMLLAAHASSSNSNEFIAKSKRATIYYLCGSYPNQYYSYTPCSSNSPQKYLCSNQGTYLGMTCTFSAQCTQV
uniref:Chitin-binding type-2 domain-containing protein n=1 Tax=Ascaris lumbricoides TaxID=6252 RepID=A0A0M3I6A4_ASCLU